MLTYLLVALGGALGSVGRFAISGIVASGLDEVFPWGTLVANVSGCLAIGLFAALTGPGGRFGLPSEARQFFMVGVCGGYTTFSSFSLQTLTLARDGDTLRAGLNIAASLVLCLVGVWLGTALGGAFHSRPA